MRMVSDGILQSMIVHALGSGNISVLRAGMDGNVPDGDPAAKGAMAISIPEE